MTQRSALEDCATQGVDTGILALADERLQVYPNGVDPHLTAQAGIAQTFQPGQTQSFQVTGEALVDIGAPSSVSVTINGKPIVLPPGFQTPFNATVQPPGSPTPATGATPTTG